MRVQLDGLNAPVELETKLMVPVGVFAVPGDTSEIVTLHEKATPGVPETGHETDVAVLRRLTTTVFDDVTDWPLESVVVKVTL